MIQALHVYLLAILNRVIDNCGILQVLQGQVSNHQIAVEKLKKAAEVLLDTRGELTPDKDEIQKTLGKMLFFIPVFITCGMQIAEETKYRVSTSLCHCSRLCFVEI